MQIEKYSNISSNSSFASLREVQICRSGWDMACLASIGIPEQFAEISIIGLVVKA